MNVAAPSPTPAPAAAGTPAASGAAAAGQAAPTGFDALLAMVGAALAPEGEDDLLAAPAADDGTAGAEAGAVDPMAAVLAAMMATPAPVAAPVETTVAVADAATAGAAAAPAPAAAAAETFMPAPPDATLPRGDLDPSPALGKTAEPATAAPAPTAQPQASVQAAAQPPVEPPPAPPAPAAAVVAAAAPQTAPAEAVAKPGPARPSESAKAERPTAAAPATPTAEPKPGAAPVETETAEAVAAVAAEARKPGVDAPPAEAAQAAEPAPTAQAPAPAERPAAVAQAQAAPPHEVRGSPETVAKLSADIIRKLDGRSTRFEVALDPLGLGHVDVKVEISRQGDMTASLQFDTQAAATELRNRASELRSALEKAGFVMADNALSFDVASQDGGRGGQNAQQQQTAFDFQDRGERGQSFAGRAFQAVSDGGEALVAQLSAYAPAARDGVDIRI